MATVDIRVVCEHLSRSLFKAERNRAVLGKCFPALKSHAFQKYLSSGEIRNAECHCAASRGPIPKRGRLNTQRSQVNVALRTMMNFIIDPIKDCEIQRRFVKSESEINFLESMNGYLSPKFVELAGCFIPRCKQFFFCGRRLFTEG